MSTQGLGDVAARLRSRTIERTAPSPNGYGYVKREQPDPLCKEAAAEIDRLRTLLSSSRGEQGWRTIDSAPKDGTEVQGWREDCGPILVRWTSAGDFLTDAEAEESGMTEEQLYEESWFYADFVQGGRLAADEYPTHWQPLPSAPGSVPTSLAGDKGS
jgi:hypothetical protein